MTEESSPNPQSSDLNAEQSERREALIKLGKYVAYATPMVVATMSAAQGQALSTGSPSPTPSPPAPPT